jgi:Protein of unknown function (DUF1194)
MRNGCRSWVHMRWLAIGIAVLGLFEVRGSGAAEPADTLAEHEAPFVCATVILAIDGSGSTRDGAFQRQISAFHTAFGSSRLYHAIQDCLPGSVAFAVMTWSGADEHDLCLDWSVVSNGDEGQHLAASLAKCRYLGGTTDIGRAVDYGLRVLERAPFASFYRGLLVLTNGRTDRGAEAVLAAAQADAAAAAVTLAAYALLPSQPDSRSPLFVPDAMPLESYAANHISAGPRAFTAYSRPDDDVEALLGALVELLRQEAS